MDLITNYHLDVENIVFTSLLAECDGVVEKVEMFL